MSMSRLSDLQLRESGQRKCDAETHFERRIVIDQTPQVYTLDVLLHFTDWNDVVAFRRRILFRPVLAIVPTFCSTVPVPSFSLRATYLNNHDPNPEKQRERPTEHAHQHPPG